VSHHSPVQNTSQNCRTDESESLPFRRIATFAVELGKAPQGTISTIGMSEAGGANGSGPTSAVAALQLTHESLATIRDRLTPFLQLASSTDAEADERALAQAAIALSIATLRVIGYRLRGQDRGKAPEDPLRQELNRIRTALQEANAKCKAKQKERKEESTPASDAAAAAAAAAAGSNADQPLRSDASQQRPSQPPSNATANHKRKQQDDEPSAGEPGETENPSEQTPSSASKKVRTG
jgi:hypothetical protein